MMSFLLYLFGGWPIDSHHQLLPRGPMFVYSPCLGVFMLAFLGGGWWKVGI